MQIPRITAEQVTLYAKALRGALGRKSLADFYLLMRPEHESSMGWFHHLLIKKLQDFADGKIRKLMVFMPPQHGKSELCSRILPAYLLGVKPTCRVLSTSYSADLSSKFNRDVQRLIDHPDYKIAFPETSLNGRAVRSDKNGSWLRNKDEFEIVEHGGYYKSAGVGGGITGRSCDVAIMDDLVRGAADAASPTIRERTWDWYAQDLCSRLHNDSQQLLIMTRWHEHDIAGRILKSEDGKDWEVITFPAIKENNNNPLDPRKIGEALWPIRQGLPRLKAQRNLGERKFQCLYQQDPVANKELLVYPDWQTIPALEYDFIDQTEAFGLDFGYNDELAMVGVKIQGKQLYMKQYIYKSGLVSSTLIAELERLGVPKGALIVCDNARPEMIAELQMAGYRAVACIKGPNTKIEGVIIMQEYTIMLTAGSEQVIAEIEGYEFSIGADGKPTEHIRDGNDHGMDAGRYIVTYTRKTNRYASTPTVMDLSRDKYDNLDARYGY